MFLVTTTTKYNREFPLQPSYSVLTSDLVVPLVVLVLAHISRISHWSLSSFLKLCHTISVYLFLTWMSFSDHFQVLYHYICTLIHFIFNARDGLPSPHTLVFTVVFVLWLFRQYKYPSHINVLLLSLMHLYLIYCFSHSEHSFQFTHTTMRLFIFAHMISWMSGNQTAVNTTWWDMFNKQRENWWVFVPHAKYMHTTTPSYTSDYSARSTIPTPQNSETCFHYCNLKIWLFAVISIICFG